MTKMLKQLVLVSLIGIVFCAPDGRVIGGFDADIEDYPYQISIRLIINEIENHICGGSILNKNTILTAAHCIDWNTGFFVRVGSALHTSGGQIVNVTDIHIHPLWNFTSFESDVAILKVEDLEFNSSVQPIDLPQPHDDVPAGTNVTLTGWGLMRIGDIVLPDVLQAVHKPIMDRDECIAMHEDIEVDLDVHDPVVSVRNICAGENGVGACNGDSGGPLVWNNAVIGIVSWTVPPCVLSGYPTIYMRTSYFIDFISFYL